MRIRVVSDLHREFGEVSLPKVDCDCVVLAGDIDTKTNAWQWIMSEFSHVPVIYVCGNHEFYGENYPSLIDKLKMRAEGTNVHVLENEAVTIQGVRFFGCTLWTDMALIGEREDGAVEAGNTMNDYKRIRNSASGYKKLSPRDTRAAHLASVAAMREFFMAGDSKSSVIVTHHSPSMRSLPEHRRTELVSCAYASHLDSLIEDFQPRLWVHGHIHHNNDYMIGETRVLANPHAYLDEPNPGFVSDLVVTLDEEPQAASHPAFPTFDGGRVLVEAAEMKALLHEDAGMNSADFFKA